MRTNRLLLEDQYNIPRICKNCGGVLVFKGVGEYCCEDCGAPDYDDYGKVRRYIEEHKGATAAQIESAIGVSQRSIRQMLKEGRLEVTQDSKTFLRCEVCGKSIRSGRYCPECEVSVHRSLEAEQRAQIKKNIHGTGLAQKGEEGQKRFRRDNF
ncbi:MAG: MerR family transcriptional regulator [Butyrivibrio sp.]|nr:MerR family transcriptional regulator [Acetatifactor muris]MCM1560701.1 MerR family transcriptional regulator [Butyrivibrio sp.]